jgi:hypothetical protein
MPIFFCRPGRSLKQVARELEACAGSCNTQAGERQRAVGAEHRDGAADATCAVTDDAGSGYLLYLMLLQFLQSNLTHFDSPYFFSSIGKGWDALYAMIWQAPLAPDSFSSAGQAAA